MIRAGSVSAVQKDATTWQNIIIRAWPYYLWFYYTGHFQHTFKCFHFQVTRICKILIHWTHRIHRADLTWGHYLMFSQREKSKYTLNNFISSLFSCQELFPVSLTSGFVACQFQSEDLYFSQLCEGNNMSKDNNLDSGKLWEALFLPLYVSESKMIVD